MFTRYYETTGRDATAVRVLIQNVQQLEKDLLRPLLRPRLTVEHARGGH